MRLLHAKVARIFKEDKKGAGIQINKAEVAFTNAKGESKNKIIKFSKDDIAKYNVGSDLQLFITHNVGYDNKESKKNEATVTSKESAVEIGSTWFSILNSLFIIALAPLFSKWWESKYNPNASGKYAIGMLLISIRNGMLLQLVQQVIAPGAKNSIC